MVESNEIPEATGAAVGGHQENLNFEGDKLIKKAPRDEALAYRTIYEQSNESDPVLSELEISQLRALRPFVPAFHSSEDISEEGMIGDSTPEPVSWVTIENMCHGREGANVMDVKLGTSTATKRAQKKGAEFLVDKAKKDAKRTSEKLGLTITGIKFDGITVVLKKAFLRV